LGLDPIQNELFEEKAEAAASQSQAPANEYLVRGSAA
jgi:hypothetical protein